MAGARGYSLAYYTSDRTYVNARLELEATCGQPGTTHPADQLQREPVRKPRNRESRSHSQPGSRACNALWPHFRVNPRKP